MKSQVNAVKDTPIRIKILKRAFEEGWNLEQVNSELEKHFCERLYARNRYEAGLIYAFQNRISYEAWKELYQKYIEQGRNMENREDGIKKKLTARLLALVVIISMISALTGCNEPKEQENGVTLVYGQYNQK